MVIAILAVLVALLLPAIQKVRQLAYRLQCQANLQQIGRAFHNHHETEGAFPPALSTYMGGPNVPPPHDRRWYFSWMVRLLPYLEQGNFYQQIDFTAWPWWQAPDGPNYCNLNGARMAIYECPADWRAPLICYFSDGGQAALTDYLAVNGTNQLACDGVVYANSRTTLTAITDGTSNTILVGERPPSNDLYYGWWFAGSGDFPYFGATDVALGANEVDVSSNTTYAFGPGDPANPIDRWHYWSMHPGGANFLRADGSVHFLSYAVDPTLLGRLATRSAGEVINESEQ